MLGKTDVISRAATESLARRNHMDVLMRLDWVAARPDQVRSEAGRRSGDARCRC